jgi:hypothetical protein
MTRAVLLSEIDLSKCGPDSPLHALAKKGHRARSRELEHHEQAQREWHARLRHAGYCVDVEFGWLDMRDCLLRYLARVP